MGIGGGSGGGGFKLEKTWRATGVGTTTFNSPSNISIPFGKYEILVSGRGGTGNPNTPGNIASYNPFIPSTISGYNTAIPSSISGYNTIVPGNATGNYNPGSGGNLAGYTTSGGNLAGYNPGTPPTPAFTVYEYVTRYESAFFVPSYATGSYNPPSGGNLASYNPYVTGSANYNPITPGNANYNPIVTGTQNYNPPTPGGTATIYSAYVCEPTFPSGFTVDLNQYNSFYGAYNTNFIGYRANCPIPTTFYETVPPAPGNATGNYNPPSGGNIANYNAPSGGNIANYNPPSGGTANYNPRTPGTQNYNASQYQAATYNTLYFNNGLQYSCPTDYTYFMADAGPGYSSTYEVIDYTCVPSPIPGSPGNAVYNAISYPEVYNPYTPGNQNYNSPTGGNPNYNAAVSSTANYNPSGGQNANYNAPAGGVAGDATTVLGVYFPGGPVGTVAPYVAPTRINRYAYPDDATYPVDVPPGGYITIERK